MNDQEKAAVSVMSGLRQKFARQRGKGITYSADELHLMFSESIQKIKRDEDIIFEDDDSWDDVNDQIEKSNIKRYPWKKIFGRSLTKMILTFRKHGFTAEETISEIEKDPAFNIFLESNSNESEKIMENIRISVNSRYVENKTSDEVMRK